MKWVTILLFVSIGLTIPNSKIGLKIKPILIPVYSIDTTFTFKKKLVNIQKWEENSDSLFLIEQTYNNINKTERYRCFNFDTCLISEQHFIHQNRQIIPIGLHTFLNSKQDTISCVDFENEIIIKHPNQKWADNFNTKKTKYDSIIRNSFGKNINDYIEIDFVSTLWNSQIVDHDYMAKEKYENKFFYDYNIHLGEGMNFHFLRIIDSMDTFQMHPENLPTIEHINLNTKDYFKTRKIYNVTRNNSNPQFTIGKNNNLNLKMKKVLYDLKEDNSTGIKTIVNYHLDLTTKILTPIDTIQKQYVKTTCDW